MFPCYTVCWLSRSSIISQRTPLIYHIAVTIEILVTRSVYIAMAPNRSDSFTRQFNLTPKVKRSCATVFVIIYRLKSRHLRSSPHTRHYITRVITAYRRPQRIEKSRKKFKTRTAAAAAPQGRRRRRWIDRRNRPDGYAELRWGGDDRWTFES